MGQRKKTLLLLVDDNPHNLQVLGNIVEEEGYEAAVAMDGKEALEFLKKDKPELILLDIMMPVMDGYEACELIKANELTQDIPIIFLTAKAETGDIVRGFQLGAVDYVTKPFRAAELLARVKTHIQLKRARDEIKTLKGMLPMCANCKKIRDDDGYWKQVEQYIETNSEAEISHGICPNCMAELYPEFYGKDANKNKTNDEVKVESIADVETG